MTIITRRRGDTYADEIIVTSEVTGAAMNVTGYTFKLTVDPSKAPADGTTKLYEVVGTIVDGPAGKVEFAPTEQQANQTPGTYYYDIQMTDGNGRKRTIALDKYVYQQDITK